MEDVAPAARRLRAADISRARRRASALVPRPELWLLLGVAAALNLWALDLNGWANTYYSAAVRSMSTSWHAFLYGSFDPSGVTTVDKPPLSLWVQALSARAFGFGSLSILVPQALMGVAGVWLTYDLTARRWGRLAGFVAGLALAVTPITVAISRHNNPDALLVLCCVAAIWFFVRALEDGRLRWLLLAGAMVGLGFEAKMGVALLIVPAMAIAWLWVAPAGRARAIRDLLASGAAMVAVGGAWPLLMVLTPAGQRPWISGTADNDVLSLILGYNGLGRIGGQAGGPQGLGGGGGPFGGETGPLRLLNESLGGQAGWLLGLAAAGGIALALACGLRRRDPRTGWLIAVGGSFAVIAVVFSFAKGIFHPYYVSLLAPFAAALTGAAVGLLRRDSSSSRIVAPLVVAAGLIGELIVLGGSGTLGWLMPLLIAGGAGLAVALAGELEPRIVRPGLVAAAAGLLLVAPAIWSVQTIGHPTAGTFPAGGPEPAGAGPGGPGGAGPGGGPPGGGPFAGDGSSVSAAVDYAASHGGGAIVLASQSEAAGEIIDSGAEVAGIGGFSGRETTVSVDWLADGVASGRIRWVLADGSGAGPGLGFDGREGSSAALAAVTEACTPASGDAGSAGLYDCSGAAVALAAAATSGGQASRRPPGR